MSKHGVWTWYQTSHRPTIYSVNLFVLVGLVCLDLVCVVRIQFRPSDLLEFLVEFRITISSVLIFPLRFCVRDLVRLGCASSVYENWLSREVLCLCTSSCLHEAASS